MMNTLDAIKTRQSTRNFSAKPLEEEQLQTILEAGAYAPNGADVEVFYSVVRSKNTLQQLAALAAAAMKQDPGYDPFYGATTVVILSAEPHPIGCDLANAACAAENMLLAATELGVGSIYLLGFVLGLKDDAQLQKAVGIPEGKTPLLGIALGYSQDGLKPARVRKNNHVTFID
jgi:nitroreductase